MEHYILCKSQKSFEVFNLIKTVYVLNHLDYSKVEEKNDTLLKIKTKDLFHM